MQWNWRMWKGQMALTSVISQVQLHSAMCLRNFDTIVFDYWNYVLMIYLLMQLIYFTWHLSARRPSFLLDRGSNETFLSNLRPGVTSGKCSCRAKMMYCAWGSLISSSLWPQRHSPTPAWNLPNFVSPVRENVSNLCLRLTILHATLPLSPLVKVCKLNRLAWHVMCVVFLSGSLWFVNKVSRYCPCTFWICSVHKP